MDRRWLCCVVLWIDLNGDLIRCLIVGVVNANFVRTKNTLFISYQSNIIINLQYAIVVMCLPVLIFCFPRNRGRKFFCCCFCCCCRLQYRSGSCFAFVGVCLLCVVLLLVVSYFCAWSPLLGYGNNNITDYIGRLYCGWGTWQWWARQWRRSGRRRWRLYNRGGVRVREGVRCSSVW